MVIIDRMHKEGYKWFLVEADLILAAWFGIPSITRFQSSLIGGLGHKGYR